MVGSDAECCTNAQSVKCGEILLKPSLFCSPFFSHAMFFVSFIWEGGLLFFNNQQTRSGSLVTKVCAIGFTHSLQYCELQYVVF